MLISGCVLFEPVVELAESFALKLQTNLHV